jgi:hypothetical protein
MIDIKKANVGDFVHVLLTVQSSPVFCEIVSVLELESAIEVSTDAWGRRIVMAQNAYWEEKEAKKSKIVKLRNNYNEWAKEYLHEETETDSRIDTIHHRQSEVSEDTRKVERSASISKSTKRKSKVVRKSTTKKRKTTRNRKISRSKK